MLNSKIMKYLLIFGLMLFYGCLYGQKVQNEHLLIHPQLAVAGYDMNKYLSEHLYYPDSAMAHNLEGRVIVKFMVNEDGSISDCKILRGLSPECDSEALRVFRSMPPWKPNKQKGKPVKMSFSFPVLFKLTD